MSMKTLQNRPAGRQRDPGLDEAILATAAEQLAAVGYDALSVESVARLAGVAKTTLLRRWRTKAELVVAAVHWIHDASHILDSVDTGTLRGDLLAEVGRMSQAITAESIAQTAGLFLAMRRDPELGRVFREQIIDPQKLELASVLRRAADRGEVSDAALDLTLFDEVIPSLILSRRFVLDLPVDAAFASQLVDSILLPALLAVSNTRTAPTAQLEEI